MPGAMLTGRFSWSFSTLPLDVGAFVGADDGINVGANVDADVGVIVDTGGCTGKLSCLGHGVHIRTGIGSTKETALVLETLAGHASLL